jgi:large subunit ribosomal protein L13
VSTYTPKASDVERAWHIVDAEGLVLGRLSTEVANILRGKHKPTYTPHMDMGDHVIIEKKLVHRHSGYPGGLRSETYADKMARKPEQAVMDTIRGMIPKTRLGRAQISKLKVYAGPTHPHAAQNPQPLEIAHATYEARA